ncbi:Sigma-54-dependent Fis family transcriptional regulator [Gammaproteobacteria bacterium]
MNTFEQTLLGNSPQFRAVIRTAHLVATTDVTVLISGESGTGKELMARALHRESRRAMGPFVPINCAALPEGLAESELFGHRRGSFTGATAEQIGHIRAAEGGTLFLDEVSELPLAIQGKLLRFLESGECQVVGNPTPTSCNTRIVAATNRNLLTWVEAGRFREDLYYRLNVVPLELPPLRKRMGDLPHLLLHLTAKLAHQHGLAVPHYATAALEQLQRYSWPGNVRELRNFCERMVVLFPGGTVEFGNLPAELRNDMPLTSSSVRTAVFDLPENGIVLDDLEANFIRQALSRTRGNRSQAARLVGLTRDTLLYRIKKYAIEEG